MSDEEIKDDATPPDDLQAKCDEYLAGWKRALADYDNIKKDLGRERSDMRAGAVMDAAMRVIPVLDNLDTAMKHAPTGDDKATNAWVVGIGFIKNQLEEAVGEMGAEQYGAVGETFDANLHDAVGDREEAGAPNTIVEIVSRGWKLGNKIVRPAKVIIAK